VIDHIYATADIADAVKARGFVNSDAVPKTDHICQYVDLEDSEIFGSKGREPAKSKARKLTSDNPIRVELYVKRLEELMVSHKLEEKLDRLVEDIEANDGKLGPGHYKRYDTIDGELTCYSIAAEKQCAREKGPLYTPEIGKVRDELRKAQQEERTVRRQRKVATDNT
jgi:predicted small lipoprotein YifL